MHVSSLSLNQTSVSVRETSHVKKVNGKKLKEEMHTMHKKVLSTSRTEDQLRLISLLGKYSENIKLFSPMIM